MNHHSFSCQGESHKYSDKPCQDSSYSYSGNGISIAIVCDGHGGERYFRSDIGSQICIKVTENAIKLLSILLTRTCSRINHSHKKDA